MKTILRSLRTQAFIFPAAVLIVGFSDLPDAQPSADHMASSWILAVGAIVLLISIGMMAGWRYLSLLRLNRELKRLVGERNKAEDALRISEKKYRLIFENVQDVFFQTDVNGNFIDVSPSVFHYSGFSREELIGKPVSNFYADPDDRMKLLTALQKTGKVVDYELVLKTKDNPALYASLNAHFLYDASGQPSGIEGALRDITERKRMEEALRESEARLSNITDMIGEGLYVLDEEGRIQFINPEAEKLLGWSESELLGKEFYEVIHCEKADGTSVTTSQCSILKTIGTGGTYRSEDNLFMRRDGALFPVSIVATPLRKHGQIGGTVVVFQDITDRKRMEAELEMLNEFLVRQATTDPLTGISNRVKFTDALNMEIRRAGRFGSELTLIMFDVDHFKDINDTYGHQAGDKVLRTLTSLVAHSIRASDLFARWGGEEFMILILNTSVDKARVFAEKLRHMIDSRKFPGVGHVTCSFGVAQMEADDNDDRFTRRVDNALYRAKAKGRNRVEVA
ncbi:MAG TPA: diguanylate cyclase [Nitrospirota bacterium]|nr:diguanylate cyclase [Nitrospirota bacterium]